MYYISIDMDTQTDSNSSTNILKTKIRKTDDPQYFTKLYHATNKPMVCECGLPITSRGLYYHRKTKKHIFLMEHKL